MDMSLKKEASRMSANGLQEKELKTLLTSMKCKILVIVDELKRRLRTVYLM